MLLMVILAVAWQFKGKMWVKEDFPVVFMCALEMCLTILILWQSTLCMVHLGFAEVYINSIIFPVEWILIPIIWKHAFSFCILSIIETYMKQTELWWHTIHAPNKSTHIAQVNKAVCSYKWSKLSFCHSTPKNTTTSHTSHVPIIIIFTRSVFLCSSKLIIKLLLNKTGLLN